jgi:hypothetical protein
MNQPDEELEERLPFDPEEEAPTDEGLGLPDG